MVIKHFFRSFTEKKILHIFLLDASFWAFLALLFSGLGKLLKTQSENLLQGRTPEEVQQLILTNVAQTETFLSGLKTFFFTLLGGTFLALLVFLLLISLTQGLIWHFLSAKKFKNYGKWNLLHLALIVPLMIYLFFFFMFKLGLNQLLALLSNQTLMTFFNDLFVFFALLIFAFYLFAIYYSFLKEHKIWHSLGEAFHLLKINFPKLGKVFLLSLATALILGLINVLLAKLSLPNLIFWSNLFLSLLYLAWLRVYFYQTVHHEPAY